jgi:hypothetical protein
MYNQNIQVMAYNEKENDYNHLEELGGSDFEIAEGQPNIKGWEVKNSSGLNCGEVDELLFNPASRKVRYMVIDLDDNELHLQSRKVLIPIGMATLHNKEDYVTLSGITTEQLQELPDYHKGKVTPATESSIRNLLTGAGATGFAESGQYTTHEEGFYDHDHFNEERFYGERRTSAKRSSPLDTPPPTNPSTGGDFQTFDEDSMDSNQSLSKDEQAFRDRLKRREDDANKDSDFPTEDRF